MRQNHLLKLIVSCRKVSAQVTNRTTNTIIAMSCSSEVEYNPNFRAVLEHRDLNIHRPHYHWNSDTASRIATRLGPRLLEIGVDVVNIDVAEEICRPVPCRQLLAPFFVSLQKSGVLVNGAHHLML